MNTKIEGEPEGVDRLEFGDAALLLKRDGRVLIYANLDPSREMSEAQVGAFALARCVENHSWYSKVKRKVAEAMKLELAFERESASAPESGGERGGEEADE